MNHTTNTDVIINFFLDFDKEMLACVLPILQGFCQLKIKTNLQYI